MAAAIGSISMGRFIFLEAISNNYTINLLHTNFEIKTFNKQISFYSMINRMNTEKFYLLALSNVLDNLCVATINLGRICNSL